jgi:hypothetical protein
MNTNQPVDCLRCHAHMKEGFVADFTHAGIAQQTWSPGAPTRSFWTGIKVEEDQAVPAFTLRCPNCGYLESYAIAPASSEG